MLSRFSLASLRKISEVSDYLVFELGFNKGKSCIKTDKFNHYKELIRLLEENTTYTNFKLIGKTRLWGYYTRFLVEKSEEYCLLFYIF